MSKLLFINKGILVALLLAFGYSQKVVPYYSSGGANSVYYWITSKLGISQSMVETTFTVIFIIIVLSLIYFVYKRPNG